MDHYGKRGTGEYMKRTAGHKALADMLIPRVLATIDNMNVPEDATFVICDFGAADGGSSRDLIKAAVGKLRSGKSNPEVQVCYNDLPNADFTSLFMMLHDDGSYASQYEDVCVSANGRSFLQQCLPRNSLHLGISTTAMHWLASLPCQMKESVFAMSPLCSEEERKCYRDQAADEWNLILKRRQTELISGGRLIFCAITSMPDNQIMFLSEKLWIKYRDQGTITNEEFLNTNVIFFFKSRDVVLAPFENKEGLKLMRCDSLVFPCPFLNELQSTDDRDDLAVRRACASRIVHSCRAYLYGSYINGLSNTRSSGESARIVDQLFADMIDIVEEDPAKYTSAWCSLVVEAYKP